MKTNTLDLKMENVMMNSIHTQIKIVDFGLSNAYDPGSPLRTHCGSPEYAAPELFVPGKSYGPEVDLWSLGVILYGMVVGQLPFVTLREEHMSSQERRKKLLVQINKGYSPAQRKSLSLVTPDFRGMISRMLTADALKRITIDELILHAWVTDKGKKTIIINPLKSLDENWQISIMKEVGILLQLEWPTIRYAISNEPQGDIAGMYNILVYKLQSQRLEGDGVTKTIPNHISNYTISRPHTSVPATMRNNSVTSSYQQIAKKRIERVKSPAIHKIQKVNGTSSPHTAPPNVTPDKRPQTTGTPGVRPIIRRFKNSPRTEPGESKPKEKKKNVIPSSDVRNRLQIASDIKQTDLNWTYGKQQQGIQVPLLTDKRRAASSPYRPQLVLPSTLKPTLNRRSLPQSVNIHSIRNEINIVGSKGLAKVLMTRKIPSADIQKLPKPNEKESSNVALPASKKQAPKALIITDPKSKSEPAPNIRMVTSPTTTTTVTVINRSVKRTRVIPVMGSPSAPANPATPLPTPVMRSQQMTTLEKPRGNYVERSPYALGDAGRKRPSTTKHTQRTIVNEPIAKSIIDYIANNMPGKLNVSKREKNLQHILS